MDNSPVNLVLMRSILEPHGYRVVAGASAGEGLELARQTRPAMIISGVHMPGQDGFDFIRQVKADPSLAGIPFIITSATRGTRRERDESMKLGASRFISTPLEPEILLNAIRQALK